MFMEKYKFKKVLPLTTTAKKERFKAKKRKCASSFIGAEEKAASSPGRDIVQ